MKDGGVIVLKRLSDARRDGNPIVAVILGTAVGQDGASAGLTVPSKEAQASVIRAALANARVMPSAIGYVECHGTGTPLGDPIEVRALASVLCVDRDPSRPLVIGSVKTNVGHLESASGIAGLIKAALAVQRGVVPAHLHFERPNPHIEWHELPLQVPRETMPWLAAAAARVAGVSSFGASGTNAHVIVGHAPDDDVPVLEGGRGEPAEEDYSLLLLSARSEPSLSAFAEGCREELEAGRPLADMADVMLSSRTRHQFRTAIVARSAAEAADALRDRAQAGAGRGVFVGRAAGRGSPGVAGLFTGQGALYAGMGRELFARERAFRVAFERCDEALQTLVGWSVTQALLTLPDAELIATERAQPVLFALQVSLASMWSELGIHLRVVAGHSIGEVAAAHASGIVSFEDACRWVAARARLMQASSSGGAMLAVRLPEAEAREFAARVAGCELAVVNGNSRCVLAGGTDAIEALEHETRVHGIHARRLRVSHAFHSSQMDSVVLELRRELADLSFRPPTIPLISSVTGEILDAATAIRPDFWAEQVRKPVRFAAAAQRLARMDLRHALELGPQPQLLEVLAEDHPGRFVLVPSLRRGSSDRFVQMCAAAALMADGVDVQLPVAAKTRSRGFPPYPFERTRYWMGAPKQQLSTALEPAGSRVYESVVDLASLPALGDHRIGGAVVVPASFWLASVLDRDAERENGAAVCFGDVVFERALVLAPDERRRMRITVDAPAAGYRFRIETCAFDTGASEDWIVHARGVLRVTDASVPHERPTNVGANCSMRVSGDLLREAFASVGIELGPHFSWITEAWIGRGEAFAMLRADQTPGGEARDGGARVPHWPSGLLDSLFQLLGATLDFDQRAGIRVPYLLEELRATHYSGTELHAHATLRPGGAEQLVGDLRLWSEDPSAPCDLSVRGLHLKPVTLRALEGARMDRDAAVEIRWTPVSTTKNLPCQGPWLIIGDEHGLAGELRRLLVQRGQTAVCYQAADAVQRLDVEPRIEPRQIVHVSGTSRGDEIAGQIVSSEAVGALGVVQSVVGGERRHESPRMWFITQDAVVLDDEPADSSGVAGAQLWGLARALALEHPELQPTLIDVRSSEMDARTLLRAIEQAGQEDQLALRGERLFVRRLARPASDDTIDVPDAPFRAVAASNTLADLQYQPYARRAPRSQRSGDCRVGGRSQFPRRPERARGRSRAERRAWSRMRRADHGGRYRRPGIAARRPRAGSLRRRWRARQSCRDARLQRLFDSRRPDRRRGGDAAGCLSHLVVWIARACRPESRAARARACRRRRRGAGRSAGGARHGVEHRRNRWNGRQARVAPTSRR